MRTSIATVWLLALTAGAADAPLPKDLAGLQGVWKLTALATGDREAPPPVEFRWHIQGNRVNYGGAALAVVTLDSKTKPASIDLAFIRPERTLEGIYSLAGDTLKVCVNKRAEGVKERPQEFSTKNQADFCLLTFTRLKGDKIDPLEGLAGFVGLQLRGDTEPKQVVVVDTIKDSPAAKAGLKKDDVLVQVNGGAVKELRAVVETVRRVKPGNNLSLRVRRDGKDVDVTVRAGIVPFFVLD